MIRFLEGRLRHNFYLSQLEENKKKELLSCSYNWLQEKKRELNRSKFASEQWFKKLLIKHLTKSCRVETNKPVINRYFVDFYFPSLSLAVEIDGGFHRNRKDYDKKRDERILLHSPLVRQIIRIEYLDHKRALEVIATLNDLIPDVATSKKFKSLKRPKQKNKWIQSKPSKKRRIKKAVDSWIKAGLDVKKMKEWFDIK